MTHADFEEQSRLAKTLKTVPFDEVTKRVDAELAAKKAVRTAEAERRKAPGYRRGGTHKRTKKAEVLNSPSIGPA